MFDSVDFIPEPYDGPDRGRPVRDASNRYQRMEAEDFKDEPARLTDRQAYFYRNLIALALATGTRDLPVDFTTADGQRMYLDRGCIKIAEAAGFIEPLQNNDPGGCVGHITLAWRVQVSD